MNQTETGDLLRLRRELTGTTWNDETIAAWAQALKDQDYDACRTALLTAAQTDRKITVAHVVEQLPRHARVERDDRHARTCICDGRGWIEVEQTDGRTVWLAWDRCPNGPRTGFHEVD